MGIKDTNKLIEEWLATIAPGAFFYKLPKGVTLSLIVRDLSSMLVSAFMSNSSTTGFTFVRNLTDTVQQFALSEIANAEGSDTIDWDDGSLASKRKHPEAHPSPEDLEKLRSESYITLGALVTKRAQLILTRDSQKHMPANREILHEERYGETGSERDTPFTFNELKEMRLSIRSDRPMPGMTEQGELRGDGTIIRNRANRTPQIREAYQNYGPWALARDLRSTIEDLKQSKSAAASSTSTIFEKQVIIDSILVDFPEDYETRELWELPYRWGHGHHETHQYALNGSFSHRSEPLRIGEADRKMVWYALNHSKKGDHVLICSNDSDILFILLMNAHLFRDENGTWTRTIFLDMNTANMKKERYERRFVCINKLVEFLESKVPENPLAGIPCPTQVLTVIALTMGSDYTENPFSVGPKKIMETFEEMCKLHKDELFDLVRLGQPKIKDDLGTVESAKYGSWVDGLQLVLLSEDHYDCFLRRLYQRRITQKTIKKYRINEGALIPWEKIHMYLSDQDGDKKDPEKYRVPSTIERNGDVRRLLWVLHYWMNSHHNHGDFPSSDVDVLSTGQSVWGWSRVRSSITDGRGNDRFINAHGIKWTRQSLLENEVILEKSQRRDKDPFVCCKNNNIVTFDEIWDILVAEKIYRASHPQAKALNTPFWRF